MQTEPKVVQDNVLQTIQNIKEKCVTWSKWTIGITRALKEVISGQIIGYIDAFSKCYKMLSERQAVVDKQTTSSTNTVDERAHFGKSLIEVAKQVSDCIIKFDKNGNFTVEELKAVNDLIWNLITFKGDIPPYECVKYSDTNIIFLDYSCSILFKLIFLKSGDNAQNFVFDTLRKCLSLLQNKDITKILYERVSDFVMNVVVGETSLTGRNGETINEFLKIGNDEIAKQKYDGTWSDLVKQINDIDDELGKKFR